MNIHMYQYNAKKRPGNLSGKLCYELDYFSGTDDFTAFECEMESNVRITTLMLEIDLRNNAGVIYNPDKTKLDMMPMEYWVNRNNYRECFSVMLLNRFPVAVEFKDSWLRMFHLDDDSYNLNSMTTAIEDDIDVQESLRGTIDGFNIKLAVDFALYSSSYDRYSKNTSIYY